jgi:hypothetical protein
MTAGVVRRAFPIALVALAYWLGEGQFVSPAWAAACVLGACAVAAWRPDRAAIKALAGAACLAAMAAAYYAGLRSFSHAFNECVRDGESVRVLLADRRRESGRYPDDLSALSARLPGRRLLRPTLLDYERTPAGYTLRFRDFLVEHRATESSSFFASK